MTASVCAPGVGVRMDARAASSPGSGRQTIFPDEARTRRVVASFRAVVASACAEASADGFSVRGTGLRPGQFDAGGDHRMAMSAAVAATAAGTVRVIGVEAAGVSWPGFAEALEQMWSSR